MGHVVLSQVFPRGFFDENQAAGADFAELGQHCVLFADERGSSGIGVLRGMRRASTRSMGRWKLTGKGEAAGGSLKSFLAR